MVMIQRVKTRFTFAEEYAAPLREFLRGRAPNQASSKKMLVIIASNRGLCGNYNSSLFSIIEEFMRSNKIDSFAVVGKKSFEFLRRRRIVPIASDGEINNKPDFNGAAAFFRGLNKEQREVYVAYNAYKSASNLLPTISRLYPVPEEVEYNSLCGDYILEPTAKELVGEMLEHYIEVRFFQMVLSAMLGEMSARMMVLSGAVDNSKELIGQLRISINKARQMAITRDLSEVTASAEVMRGDENE